MNVCSIFRRSFLVTSGILAISFAFSAGARKCGAADGITQGGDTYFHLWSAPPCRYPESGCFAPFDQRNSVNERLGSFPVQASLMAKTINWHFFYVYEGGSLGRDLGTTPGQLKELRKQSGALFHAEAAVILRVVSANELLAELAKTDTPTEKARLRERIGAVLRGALSKDKQEKIGELADQYDTALDKWTEADDTLANWVLAFDDTIKQYRSGLSTQEKKTFLRCVAPAFKSMYDKNWEFSSALEKQYAGMKKTLDACPNTTSYAEFARDYAAAHTSARQCLRQMQERSLRMKPRAQEIRGRYFTGHAGYCDLCDGQVVPYSDSRSKSKDGPKRLLQ